MAKTAAETVIEGAIAAGITLVVAESCTAGLVADLLAEVPGASQVLWGSFVTYSADAKIRMLGIDEGILRRFGVVSGETAQAMARGALERSGAGLAVSVTGLAGPGGDGSAVPVGTVWIGAARYGGAIRINRFHYTGDRNGIRRSAAQEALRMLREALDKHGLDG